MGGTVAGGIKTRDKNYAFYGVNYYRDIGRRGGSVKTPNSGFGSDKIGFDGLTGRERARIVGAIGGKRSKRGKRREQE